MECFQIDCNATDSVIDIIGEMFDQSIELMRNALINETHEQSLKKLNSLRIDT